MRYYKRTVLTDYERILYTGTRDSNSLRPDIWQVMYKIVTSVYFVNLVTKCILLRNFRGLVECPPRIIYMYSFVSVSFQFIKRFQCATFLRPDSTLRSHTRVGIVMTKSWWVPFSWTSLPLDCNKILNGNFNESNTKWLFRFSEIYSRSPYKRRMFISCTVPDVSDTTKMKYIDIIKDIDICHISLYEIMKYKDIEWIGRSQVDILLVVKAKEQTMSCQRVNKWPSFYCFYRWLLVEGWPLC